MYSASSQGLRNPSSQSVDWPSLGDWSFRRAFQVRFVSIVSLSLSLYIYIYIYTHCAMYIL